jgi:hypothetical protein
MTRIVIDDNLKAQLQQVKTVALLTDAEGKTIGTVVPGDLASTYGLECPFPPEEIARRLQNPGRLYTGEEIDAMLENR